MDVYKLIEKCSKVGIYTNINDDDDVFVLMYRHWGDYQRTGIYTDLESLYEHAEDLHNIQADVLIVGVSLNSDVEF